MAVGRLRTHIPQWDRFSWRWRGVQGDRVQGDRVQGDRVQGHRVQSDRVQGHRVQGHRVQGDREGQEPDDLLDTVQNDPILEY